MSIAAVSSSFVTAARASAAPAAVDAAAAAAGSPREGGRRHPLVDAMNQALGLGAAQGKTTEQALFRFAHALMGDLRSIDADASREGPGRGVAWGRRDWSDLPQRIDALATAAAAAPPELPQQPNPVTTTSAAVHLMQVPSSRLLEAFAALREALGDQQAPADPAAGARGELAALLGRLSDTLAPDARAALPAGSVLHLTA